MLVGLFLRHFKIYSGARYISFGSKKLEKFNLFIGQNGVGKSSILEALDCFFNASEFIVNSNEKKTDAFIAPCFLISKNNIEKFDRDVQKIIPIISEELFKLQKSKSSNYDYYADFFIQRDDILVNYKETHYLVTFSEFPYRDTYREENFFFTFDSIIKSAIKIEYPDLVDKTLKKTILQLKTNILSQYSYQYIPVETSLTEFLRLESKGMQELMSEDIKNKIETILNTKYEIKQGDTSKILKKSVLEILNKELELFINGVEATIKDSNNGYSFDRELNSKTKLTANHLTDIIVEAFFSKRKLKVDKKPIEHLSAGERKRALIDIAYSFLKQDKNLTKDIILAIDEPEASLHISMCYGQFSRLIDLAKNHNVNLLVSTHWYGSLPIIDEGNLYHIHEENSQPVISEFSFQNYFQENGRYPDDIHFKSFFDLVSSIVSSLRLHNKNWLIVEAKEDKKYITKHLPQNILDNLIIMPVGGSGIVLTLYNYLYTPLSQKTEKKAIDRKVICLVDTDFQALPINNTFKDETDTKSLLIRRLQSDEKNNIKLDRLTNNNRSSTEIEECLNPKAFYNAINTIINNSNDFELKTIFNSFLFDENAQNSFIKGDNSIIYQSKASDLLGNPNQYKATIAKFIYSNKELICDEYCNSSIENNPKWIDDLSTLLM